MSLHPTSQCCKALNRRLLGRQDAVWIPESVLAHAFERYCAVSATFRRHGSSVPGPLEARRRQNKRQMGALTLGQNHGAAPSWGLENLPDLSQWCWQPPTSRHRRRQEQREDRRLWQSVLNWLSAETQDSAAVGLSPPAPSFSAATTALLDAPAAAAGDLTFPGPEGATVDPLGLVSQGVESLVHDASRDKTLFNRPAFTSFCRVLREGLETGRISGPTLCVVIPSLTGSVSRALAHNPPASLEHLKTQLLGASLDGLEALCAIRTGPYIDNEVWSMLLQESSRLPINSLRIFERIMTKIPPQAVSALRPGILANIDTFLFAIGRPTTLSSTYTRQANKMAKSCLQAVALPEHRHILQEATERLAQLVRDRGAGFQASRFCWLQVLARLSHIDEEFFVNACAFLEAGSDVEPLTQREICHIFLGRLNSRHAVKHILDVYNALKTAQPSLCYPRLCFMFWRTGQPRYMKNLCTFLLRLGRQQDILIILRSFRTWVKNDATPLANLAVGFGHSELALRVYFRYHQSRFTSKKFWSTVFAQDTLHKLVETKSPGAPADRIIKTLKLYSWRPPRPRYYRLNEGRLRYYLHKPAGASQSRKPPKGLTVKQIQKAERAAVAFAHAPHLSDRKRLSLVTACYHYLASYGARLSDGTLKSIAEAVTKDLVQGQPGRVSRLRWFLRVLLKERGRDEALAAGKRLDAWRQRVLDERRAARSGR